MEPLAYLNLACANESSKHVRSVCELNPKSQQKSFSWKRLSSTACIQIASLIAIVGIAQTAMAQAILQQGDTGAQVSDLQRRLQASGCYDGSITGYFGELTREAVIRCQQKLGLTPDGIVGSATYNALAGGGNSGTGGSYPSYGEVLRLGDRGQGVTDLQNRLRSLGYFYGNVDGVFGSETQSAVTQFQRDRGITADGIVGAEVYAALNNTSTPGTNPPPISSGGFTIGDENPQVLTLQQQLNAAGYSVPTTGYYGTQTRDAVLRFQQAQGLPATGIADAQTISNLNAIAAGGTATPSRRYTIIIPTPDQPTLTRVQQVIPGAVERQSRLGNYVQVGAYATPEAADRQNQILRSRGLDARVVFQ